MLWIAGLLLAAAAPPPRNPPATPAEVVAKVVAANARLESWSCRFLERRQFVHFNQTETKQGRIRVKRGHGLRIDLEGADEEIITVDRTRALQWRPKTRQMHIYPLERGGGGTQGVKPDRSPIPFAFGDATWNPDRDHDLRLLDSPDREIGLEMMPREAKGAYVRKVLWIDPTTWLPARIQLTEESDDTIQFVFSEIQLNPPIEDSIFDLKAPPGADVVEHKDLPAF